MSGFRTSSSESVVWWFYLNIGPVRLLLRQALHLHPIVVRRRLCLALALIWPRLVHRHTCCRVWVGWVVAPRASCCCWRVTLIWIRLWICLVWICLVWVWLLHRVCACGALQRPCHVAIPCARQSTQAVSIIDPGRNAQEEEPVLMSSQPNGFFST